MRPDSLRVAAATLFVLAALAPSCRAPRADRTSRPDAPSPPVTVVEAAATRRQDVTATPAPPAAAPGYRSRLERSGVTWELLRPARAGRYVNGDWWVVGPVELAAITPRCVRTAARVRHGAMVNPDPTRPHQGYDSALAGGAAFSGYRDDLNVALEVAPTQPLALSPGTTLVSSVSHDVAGQLPQLERCALLTVVATPPPANAFRPPYCGADKRARWSADDLDLSVLAQLPPVAGAPAPRALVAQLERTWLDHLPGYQRRFLHPSRHMPDYGREIADLVGTAALTLNLDIPSRDKRALLVVLVQLGLDVYGVVRHGGRFAANGGSGSGRKLLLLLAGAALRDPQLMTCARAKGAVFAEDAQTFYVEETSAGVFNGGHGGYTVDDVGLPEWGNRHADDPSFDRKGWDSDPYRRCCTANAWVGSVLAARIMGLREAWGHPALFDYLDRYMQTEEAGQWTRSWSPFCERMWDRYRASF